jgi:hypothetical protein
MKSFLDSRYQAESNARDNVAPIAIWAGVEGFSGVVP